MNLPAPISTAEIAMSVLTAPATVPITMRLSASIFATSTDLGLEEKL